MEIKNKKNSETRRCYHCGVKKPIEQFAPTIGSCKRNGKIYFNNNRRMKTCRSCCIEGGQHGGNKIVIHLSVTQREKKEIKQTAQKLGISMMTYLRWLHAVVHKKILNINS